MVFCMQSSNYIWIKANISLLNLQIFYLPRRVFYRIVSQHNGNKYVRPFTCRNQMRCKVFEQRGILLSLESHKIKFYHLGFGSTVTRRNLGKANEKRSYKIFEYFAYVLIEEARKSYYKSDLEINVDGNIYAFGSWTIEHRNVFWWAEFKRTKGGIKRHTLYDVKRLIPTFLYVSNAKMHDVNAFYFIPYEPGNFYLIDKATGVRYDQIGKLSDNTMFKYFI